MRSSRGDLGIFSRLLANTPIHPGAILVESLEGPSAWRQLLIAIAFIELQPNPDDYMIKRVEARGPSMGLAEGAFCL